MYMSRVALSSSGDKNHQYLNSICRACLYTILSWEMVTPTKADQFVRHCLIAHVWFNGSQMLHSLLLELMVITTCEMVFTCGEHSDHTW